MEDIMGWRRRMAGPNEAVLKDGFVFEKRERMITYKCKCIDFVNDKVTLELLGYD
jgi:hypothetical protein